MMDNVVSFIAQVHWTRILFVLVISTCYNACKPSTDSTEPTEENPISLEDCLQQVLKIDLDDYDLAAFTPSTMLVKGVFGKKDRYFTLYDHGLEACVIFDIPNQQVECIFELPQPEGWENPHLLEVVSPDSILYFNFEHQALVVCDTSEVKNTFALVTGQNDYPYPLIQHLHMLLRSIDGYIGFYTWINFGAGGHDVDYHALMDERNLVAFFKPQGDSLVRRDIPIQPFLKKKEFEDQTYDDIPYFGVNSKTREVLVFHHSTDTIYTYGWDTHKIKKHVVSGSDIELVPAMLPKREDAAKVLAAYDQQEYGRHRIFYDSRSGKYLRWVLKKFPSRSENGLPPRPDIQKIEVLNRDFEVEFEMKLSENYSLPKRVGDKVYLVKHDMEKRELVVFRFTPNAGKEKR